MGRTNLSDPTSLYVDHREDQSRRSEGEETERRGVRDNAQMPVTGASMFRISAAASDSYYMTDERRERHLRRTSALKAMVGDVTVAVVRLEEAQCSVLCPLHSNFDSKGAYSNRSAVVSFLDVSHWLECDLVLEGSWKGECGEKLVRPTL